MNKTFLVVVIAGFLAILAAHGQDVNQAQLIQQQILEKIRQVYGQDSSAPTEDPSKKVSELPLESDQTIGEKISKFPVPPQEVVVRLDRSSATPVIYIDKTPYVDTEGEIFDAQLNPMTKMGIYSVRLGDKFVYKVFRAGVDVEPIVVASSKIMTNRGVVIETVTGKKISGDRVALLKGGGMLVFRGQTTAFLWEPGKALKTLTAPENFTFFREQVGDVLSTKLVLIEKIADKSLGSAVKGLGSIFGVGKKDNTYQLMNYEDSKTIEIESKRFTDPKNDVIQFYGRSSREGKSWINWFSTPDGAKFAVFMGESVSEIKALDISTQKNVILFKRFLGFDGFNAFQDANGIVDVYSAAGPLTDKVENAYDKLSKGENAK